MTEEHAADCSCADCVDIRAMRWEMAQRKRGLSRTCEECGGDVGGFHFFGCSQSAKVEKP